MRTSAISPTPLCRQSFTYDPLPIRTELLILLKLQIITNWQMSNSGTYNILDSLSVNYSMRRTENSIPCIVSKSLDTIQVTSAWQLLRFVGAEHRWKTRHMQCTHCLYQDWWVETTSHRNHINTYKILDKKAYDKSKKHN